jgi:hypothetical protein
MWQCHNIILTLLLSGYEPLKTFSRFN